MATTKSTKPAASSDAVKQITYLAAALKAPRITEAAARMGDQARDAGTRHGTSGSASRALQAIGGDQAATARDAADALGGRIREQPLVAVLIAAAIGYIVGRIGRHV